MVIGAVVPCPRRPWAADQAMLIPKAVAKEMRRFGGHTVTNPSGEIMVEGEGKKAE